MRSLLTRRNLLHSVALAAIAVATTQPAQVQAQASEDWPGTVSQSIGTILVPWHISVP
jgi:hypothetical protein